MRARDETWPHRAVAYLEKALEPVFEALMVQALEHAVSKGRDSITEADISAVRSKVAKGK